LLILSVECDAFITFLSDTAISTCFLVYLFGILKIPPMKNRLFILVCFFFSAAFMSAQTTTIPTFKTVQVRPGVIRVPGYKLPAVTTTRLSQKVLESEEIKAVTQIAPTEGNFVGTVEIGTTPKMKIELTPQNFTNTEKASLYLRFPLGISENGFSMGDLPAPHNVRDINLRQTVYIDFDVIAGKQYSVRVPITMTLSKTRTITVYYGGSYPYSALFSMSFTGTQEVSFAVTAETNGRIYFLLKETSAYQTGQWYFPKVIIAEL